MRHFLQDPVGKRPKKIMFDVVGLFQAATVLPKVDKQLLYAVLDETAIGLDGHTIPKKFLGITKIDLLQSVLVASLQLAPKHVLIIEKGG
jgi:hypothetical protein